jgi:hypothetical protein
MGDKPAAANERSGGDSTGFSSVDAIASIFHCIIAFSGRFISL